MSKYNYYEAIKQDVRDWLNEEFKEGIDFSTMDSDERCDFEQTINDDLWTCDSVTGNASGSYTFNSEVAKGYILDNLDLLREACEMMGCLSSLSEKFFDEQNYEWCDVTIRCYLLDWAIHTVLKEYE